MSDPRSAMSVLAQVTVQRSLLGRVSGRAWSVLLAAWGGVTGFLPHVLHHLGLLAGATLLAGTGGRLLFAGIALAVSIPFLLRFHRRFKAWLAPAIALAAMAAMFSVSAFVIGPRITGSEGGATRPGHEMPASHAAHHHK